MSRMIPGRIRNQGIELYEQGLVSLISQEGNLLKAKVGDCQIEYSLVTEETKCSCDFFARKGYCQHLAALEHFLKNDPEGKAILSKVQVQQESQQETKKKTSFGSVFLDSLIINEDDTIKYQLSAQGEQNPYANDIWWTLKIRRLPDDRSYVIRDIKAFLNTVRKEAYYQIGKQYFETLSLIQFDETSQELIEFLWRLIPSHSSKIDLEFILPNQGRHLSLTRGFFEEGVTLMNALENFSFESDFHQFNHLYFKELEGEDHLYQFKVIVHRQSIELEIKEKDLKPLFANSYLFYRDTFYHLNLKQEKMVTAIRSLPIEGDLAKHIHFDLDDQDKLAAHLLDFKEIGLVDAPRSFSIHDFKVNFEFDINSQNEILLQMVFDYGNDLTVHNRQELEQLTFASHFKHEEKVFKLLEKYGFAPHFSTSHPAYSAQELYDFYTYMLPQFKKMGTVSLSAKLESYRLIERPQIDIEAKGSLLDISFDFSDLLENDVDQALVALFDNNPYFVNKSGQLVIFDEETKKVSATLQGLRARRAKNGHIELDNIAAFQLSELFANQDNVSFSQHFYQLIEDLRHPEKFKIPGLSVSASLRDYQLTGVRWLSMLDHYGFAGILADDMGLGKTLQTISFLSTKLTRDSRVLILSPSSLIYNWQDEFHKFAPDVDVAVAYGSKIRRDEIIAERHQVIITSYSSFRQDFETYSEGNYDYLILDEAQVMKNAQTKIAHSLRSFEVKNCFALSGTPIENKLLEIWSIFQIILPGLLPGKKEFLKLNPKQVARYIKPFVMRRRKEEVLPELPDLIEMNYPNEMTDSQKVIYLAQLRQIQESIQHSSDADLNRRKIEILSGITRLRQICDTPRLFMDYDGESGKLESLRQLLTQIKGNGHRALIFSQFRGMLDIAEREMVAMGLTTYKITGSTPANERHEMTRAFNAGSKDAFLISLKAGGVGLNLTGADTVVLIDLWWNPAVEMQAISRAHRLGQKENVEVYRLITRGTIEEKILEMQETKKHLVTTVLDGNETHASMSVDDIREILGVSK
ncbi:DEAD/DEAH box helicase [Streptococcus agalactiae]